MVIALLVLSLAMIVGGLFAVVLGWDIVLVERGWAMVIAGSVSAGSGAVLLGIAAAVGRLGRIRAELVSLHEELSRVGAPAPPAPVMDPVDAVSSALLGGTAAAGAPRSPATEAETAESQPTLPLFMRPAEPDATTSVTEPDEDDARPQPPRPFLVRDPDDGEPDGRADGLNSDRTEDEPGSPRAAPPLRPVLVPGGRSADGPAVENDEPRRDAPAPSPPELVPSAAPVREAESGEGAMASPQPEPTVIGTYNSGDNRYVMFSDGSIEAETPEGVFRFDSLEELKEFIASGGEGASRIR